jgi:hypothetical protein
MARRQGLLLFRRRIFLEKFAISAENFDILDAGLQQGCYREGCKVIAHLYTCNTDSDM